MSKKEYIEAFAMGMFVASGIVLLVSGALAIARWLL